MGRGGEGVGECEGGIQSEKEIQNKCCAVASSI